MRAEIRAKEKEKGGKGMGPRLKMGAEKRKVRRCKKDK